MLRQPARLNVLTWLSGRSTNAGQHDHQFGSKRMDDSVIDVLVSGAVVDIGHHQVPVPATVQAALEAAGGLARLPQMWPAGPITIRRPLGNCKVDVWHFNLDDPEPLAWKSFVLQSGDLVVFAWHVEEL